MRFQLIPTNPLRGRVSPAARTSRARRLLALALPLALVGATQLGCRPMRPQPMVSAAGVPASQGTVQATAGDNGNTKLSIKVKHLAPPAKVEPDATVYVVWIQTENGESQNVGALRVDDNLEGRLDTVTPHRRFAVSVTPERSGQVAAPTHDPVFTSEVNRN